MSKISLHDAALRVGVSDRTIRRWIAQGLLPAERLGPKLIRVNTVDLDRLQRPIPTAVSPLSASIH
jgi:excisionase family DNA binding protein